MERLLPMATVELVIDLGSGRTLPLIYILGHVFKLIGGAVGGWLAEKRRV
jgi:hypothetical protein